MSLVRSCPFIASYLRTVVQHMRNGDIEIRPKLLSTDERMKLSLIPDHPIATPEGHQIGCGGTLTESDIPNLAYFLEHPCVRFITVKHTLVPDETWTVLIPQLRQFLSWFSPSQHLKQLQEQYPSLRRIKIVRTPLDPPVEELQELVEIAENATKLSVRISEYPLTHLNAMAETIGRQLAEEQEAMLVNTLYAVQKEKSEYALTLDFIRRIRNAENIDLIASAYLELIAALGISTKSYFVPGNTSAPILSLGDISPEQEKELRILASGDFIPNNNTIIALAHGDNIFGRTIIQHDSLHLTPNQSNLLLLVSSFASIMMTNIYISLAMAKKRESDTIHAMIVTYNHEINNPLTIAMGFLQLLPPDEDKNIPKIQDALVRIRDIVKHIDKLSEKMPEYTSYTDGSKMIKLSE